MPQFLKETENDLNRTKVDESVPEGSVSEFVGVVTDKKDVPIPASNLSSLTLTLYNLETGALINDRNEESVLNENGGTVDEVGVFEMTFSEADNLLQDSSKQYETHVALFEWEKEDTQEEGKHELVMTIRSVDDSIAFPEA